MRVVVVTNTDLGWDCVCGAYKSLEAAVLDLNECRGLEDNEFETKEYYESNGYVFSEVELTE